jgi:hypothetical protein
MTDTSTTEIQERHHAWHLLAAFTNEVAMALTQGDASPEARLAKIGDLVAFAQTHMPKRIPPGAVAPTTATSHQHADLADHDEREAYYEMDADGNFRAITLTHHPDDGPLTDDEVATMMREGWDDDDE